MPYTVGIFEKNVDFYGFHQNSEMGHEIVVFLCDFWKNNDFYGFNQNSKMIHEIAVFLPDFWKISDFLESGLNAPRSRIFAYQKKILPVVAGVLAAPALPRGEVLVRCVTGPLLRPGVAFMVPAPVPAPALRRGHETSRQGFA